MIHIVFQQADRELLHQVMETEPSMQGTVFEIRDEWGVGPLKDIDTEEGWNLRLDWWRQLLETASNGPFEFPGFDDRITVTQIKEELDTDPELEAWIWMGQNQHDVTGYYWLIPQLKKYQGKVMIIFLNNLPFLNEKGQLFYPWSVNDILPREIIKARKLARPVTVSEFELEPDEWKKIADENAIVRVLEGGKKITGRDAGFYDPEILKNCTKEWQKASRVLMNTLHRMKIKTGDMYLMWRIKHMLSEGTLLAMGPTDKGWKDFDLKLPGAGQPNSDNQPEENT